MFRQGVFEGKLLSAVVTVVYFVEGMVTHVNIEFGLSFGLVWTHRAYIGPVLWVHLHYVVFELLFCLAKFCARLTLEERFTVLIFDMEVNIIAGPSREGTLWATNQTFITVRLLRMMFATMGARNTHKRQVHQRLHLCVICDRAFSTSQKLDRHTKTHSGIKEFKCEVCGKEFSLEENLKTHHKMHLGKKDFTCYVCHREYFTKSGLNHHLKKSHSDEGLISCSKCSFTGRTRYDIDLHVKDQHSEPFLKCQSCTKLCQTKQELKNHIMEVHSKNRPYICPVCPH
jgi:hypothetical protein